jgi:hypothetical protein
MTTDAAELLQRFLDKVDQRGTDECWPWTGARDGHGYGAFWLPGTGSVNAARISYELAYGPITSDRPNVNHHCDNPPCVNPRHLYAGTPAENTDDMVRRGRWAGGRPVGAKTTRLS